MAGPTERIVDEALGLGSQLLRMVHTRLDLATAELEREKESLARELTLAVAFAMCAGLAAFAALLWVALAFPPRARFVLLGLMFAAFLIAALVCWLVLRRETRQRQRLFSRVIDTLRRDQETIDRIHEVPVEPDAAPRAP